MTNVNKSNWRSMNVNAFKWLKELVWTMRLARGRLIKEASSAMSMSSKERFVRRFSPCLNYHFALPVAVLEMEQVKAVAVWIRPSCVHVKLRQLSYAIGVAKPLSLFVGKPGCWTVGVTALVSHQVVPMVAHGTSVQLDSKGWWSYGTFWLMLKISYFAHDFPWFCDASWIFIMWTHLGVVSWTACFSKRFPTIQQVEAYGSEKGQLSVDDITNVLKKHSSKVESGSYWSILMFSKVSSLGAEIRQLFPLRIEFDCRPGAIAASLALREPKYQETAKMGKQMINIHKPLDQMLISIPSKTMENG